MLDLTMTIRLKLTLLAVAAAVPALHAENFVIPPPTRTISELTRDLAPAKRSQDVQVAYRSWRRSIIPVVISQALDVSSSYGMRELNPVLANAEGRFGAKAAGIKIGSSAGILALEYYVIRRHPGAARVFSKLNWAGAAVTSTFAVHNYAIR